VFNRHPIVITLARSQQPPRVVTPDQLLLSPSHTQLQSKSPSDEEGLVLREVNAYLAQHNLLAAQKLLKYWVSVNPNCQFELIDTLRMIDESLNES
jgi:hypothetical protein